MSNNERIFGEMLRQIRIDKQKTLGDLARALNVTISYISDVERAKRGPLKDELIMKLAEVLEIDPDQLKIAAAKSRGAFTLSTEHHSPKAREVGAALMRGWDHISDTDFEQIAKILERVNS